MINAVSDDDDDDVASMVPEGPLSHRHPPSARHPPHPGSKDADEDDEEGAEGVECVDSGDGTIVADTARASRAARSPPPSETAHTRAWEATAALATRLEELNLTRIGKQSEMAPRGRGGSRGDFSGSVGRTAAQLSHVFSLQRPIDANARESCFLSYETVLPLRGAQLAAAGMRSNSVCASVVHKAKKTQGGGQQTTRNSLQDMSAAFASQSVAVAVALGVARRAFSVASDPGATAAIGLAQFVGGGSAVASDALPTGAFVVTSSTRLLPHALPVRIGAHNLLMTMREFATRELEAGMIRSLVPQQVNSLKSICNKICDNTDGVNVWASWVLLVHMLSDPRLRKLVQASPVTDHEVAVAYLFTNYARAEVTRRARMDQAKSTTSKRRPRDQEAFLAIYPEARAALDDDPAPGAELTRMEGEMDAQMRSETQTLSLKRKRPPCSGVVQVSGGILDYWSAALGSEYASILKLMITQSRALANQASIETLTGQAPPGFSSERNALLVDISSRNAVKRAEALSELVVTTPERVPKVVTWRCRNAEGRATTHTGLVRSSADAANTTVHAASMPPKRLQEASGHTRVAWSHAVRNATPHDASTSLVPGVVEGIAHLEAITSGKLPTRGRHQTARVAEAVKHRCASSACDGSLDVTLTGVARGFIVLRAKLVVGESQVRAGKEIAESMREAHAAAREAARGTPLGEYETVAVTSEAALGVAAEPFATPSNNLALALEANEQLRVLYKSKSHRGDPCRHLCGVVTAAEMAEPSCEEHDRPQTLLPIVDCKVDLLDDPDAPVPSLAHRRDAGLATVAITLTVCGDAPVRLPELLDLFAREERADGTQQMFEIVALICAGAARASELNDASTSVAAGSVNSSIASAKRILVGDLNMRLFCTIFQVYRVGTSNVPRSFETTQWSGTYGAGFDVGTSGGIGIRASSLTADKRCDLHHTTTPPHDLTTSPPLVPRAGTTASSSWRKRRWTSGAPRRPRTTTSRRRTRTTRPCRARRAACPTRRSRDCTRTWTTTPTRWSARARSSASRTTAPSTRCSACPSRPLRSGRRRTSRKGAVILRNPTPRACARKPRVVRAACADPTVPKRFRNPDDAVGAEGRAFQVDATCADVAIMREPLVPCVAITSPQDCIFGQSQPFLASVLGAAAALSRLARAAFLVAHPGVADNVPAEREVHFLYTLLKAFYDGARPPRGASHYWAASAAVLLNSIFTCAHGMADRVIASGNAKAPAVCAARMRSQQAAGAEPIGAPLKDLVSAAEYAEAKAWWAPFVRPQESLNCWVTVCPLVTILSKTNGSLDLATETLDEVWGTIHTLVCAGSWLHASPDGMRPPVEPSPLAGLRSASQVRAEHVTPTFVGKANSLHGAKPATACIVGVMPMGLQQLLALLQGASSDHRVVVNYAHNFSFLIYRPSAAPDIKTNRNKDRSSKAISCVNVEGDDAAFGTREDKLEVCKLHRVAWRDNLNYVRPICLRVATPRPDRQRSRGDRAAVDYCKERKRELDAEQLLTQQQVIADGVLRRAVLGA